jgi:3-oxoacyl-(acyl-carrier-protein) synthase
MYIRSIYKQISDIEEVSVYRKQLKEISKINLRQSSKFNVMAVLGAMKCMKNISYDKNLSIYLASEYSCTQNMLNVITQVNTKDDMVMPFDFLNINTNNAGFFIAQALDTVGSSLNITSWDLSFEKALEMAYSDLLLNEATEALIGGVDESLENIIDDYKLIHNLENQKIKDGKTTK